MMEFNAEYWKTRWDKGQTAWDIGGPAPAILHYFSDDAKDRNSAIMIPGCGNAYEAAALYEMGYHNITLVEIVKEKAWALQAQFKNTSIHVLHQDFFAHQGQYDYIIEHTFFCSLHPNNRSAYAAKMASLLKDNGTLFGILFNREFEGEEPPFGGNIPTYEMIFNAHFKNVKIWHNEHSILPRKDKEVCFACSN